MESFLKERQILFRTALSRKLFFHRYQRFGMDEVHFTEAEGNVNDLVWEYGSIHQQWMYEEPGLFDEDGERIDPNNVAENAESAMEYNEDIGDLSSNYEQDRIEESKDGYYEGSSQKGPQMMIHYRQNASLNTQPTQ